MAHFAKVNSDNIVEAVIVVSNVDEEEGHALDVCRQIDSDESIRWIQGSYTARIRNKMPNIGDTYDESKDVFISPQPFPSWTLNESTNTWVAPIPYPVITEENALDAYVWDEELYQSDNTKGWSEL